MNIEISEVINLLNNTQKEFQEKLVEAIRVAYLTGHGTGFKDGQENTDYSAKEA